MGNQEVPPPWVFEQLEDGGAVTEVGKAEGGVGLGAAPLGIPPAACEGSNFSTSSLTPVIVTF